MRSLNLKLKKSKQALYLQIADAVKDAILHGQLRPSERLPSSRILSENLGVHRHTVMEALEELIAQGWLTSQQRKGYFVIDELPIKYMKTFEQKKINKPDQEFKWKWLNKLDLPEFRPTIPVKYNFQSGLPDLNLFPRSEFHYHVSRALKKSPDSLLDYGAPEGLKKLRESFETCLRRLKNISGRTTIITNGSQEAIFLTIQLLIKKGDYVAIEDPGYPPVQILLKHIGAKIIPLKVDAEGIDPKQFEKKCKKNRIKMIFITPLHQFPTTVTLSAPRRIQVYEIARKYKIAILEDDYDHEFHYSMQPLTPMASEDSSGQIIYLATLSKIMFPSARLGFMSVPDTFAKNFITYRRLATHQNEAIIQMAFANWIIEGGFERHLNKMRRVYKSRLETMDLALQTLQNKGKNISWKKPYGGMAIWLNLHKNSDLIARKCLEQGLFVNPESYYKLNKKPGTHLRLGFTNQSDEKIREGINILSEIL